MRVSSVFALLQFIYLPRTANADVLSPRVAVPLNQKSGILRSQSQSAANGGTNFPHTTTTLPEPQINSSDNDDDMVVLPGSSSSSSNQPIPRSILNSASTCQSIMMKAGKNICTVGGGVMETIRKQSRIKFEEIQSQLQYTNEERHSFPNLCRRIPNMMDGRKGVILTSTAVKKKRRNNSGFYYGIRDDIFFPDKDEDNEVEIDNDEKNDGSTISRMEENERRQYSDTYKGGRMDSDMGTGGGIGGAIRPYEDNRSKSSTSSDNTLSEIMGETLFELREMREEIMGLREEMQYLKEEFKQYKEIRSPVQDDLGDDEEGDGDGGDVETYQYPIHEEHSRGVIERMKRKNEFESIAKEVEKWAHKMLFEEDGEEFGWKEVKCSKMVRKKFNRNGSTTCYMKWLRDPRGKYATLDDQEYPCIKCFATFNAPLEEVCEYLSQESHMQQYNDLVVAHRDLEDITPHSKITWSQCPQILFVKPRDFVTFCHHRWRKDGTQIVVSQACEHEDSPGSNMESDDKACRAYSLRGANFISRDPTDPENKTRMAILAHAHAGGGIPAWAMKTAVNAVAPIEPFKLFSRIEEKVIAYRESLPPPQQRADFVNSSSHHGQGRTSRPAGLSQLGYACFWPNGGGRIGQKPPGGDS